MTLSDERQIIQLWDAFADSGFRYAHDSGKIDKLDPSNDDRRDRLPVRQDLLQNFLDGELDLTTFKQEMDSECTQYKLWGFSGFSGQMFFNMLVSSAAPDDQPALSSLLREVLVAPEDHEEAVEHISRLTEYVEQLRLHADNPRSAPSKGYIPYFLSYFWQLQKPDRYPIYYKSIRRTLSDLAIWEPSNELADDYIEFWNLNEEIRTVLENHTDDDIHLWTIERMCLFWLSRDTITDTTDSAVSDPLHEGSTERPEPRSLPDSYIPPIVSVLPDLSQNTEEMQDIANEMGRAVETLFEDRLMKCLRMLGYTIDPRGQGSGRNPDGIATARRHSYAIIYDAKVRQDGYRFSTNDERQFRDYIDAEIRFLHDNGFRNVYFAVVSSTFDTHQPDPIRRLKIETDIQEVRLIEAGALLEVLETRLRDPDFTLGPGGGGGPGLQDFFAESGVLNAGEVQEQLSR